MLYNLKNSWEVKDLYNVLNNYVDKGYVVEVKRKAPQRSLRQNNYLYLILGFFASEYGCSIEEAKIDFYKRTCNKDIFEREGVNKSGKVVKYLRSSKDLNTAEMCLSVERFRNWSSAVAGIYLPAPNEEEFLAFCAREIERSKEYV